MVTRSGWNPTRRNRNIGTEKSGHGQDNRLVIPSNRNDDNVFWGNLASYSTVTRQVRQSPFSILVEATRQNSFHACTVDDLFQMLRIIPAGDLEGLRLLIMR